MEKEKPILPELELLFRQKVKLLFGRFCRGLLDRKELEDGARSAFEKIKDLVSKNAGEDSK